MAYRDPYAEQYARSQPHNDGADFNPYGGQHQPHQSYDQGGYDDPYYHDPAGGYRDDPQIRSAEESASASTLANKEASDFVNGTGKKWVNILHHVYWFLSRIPGPGMTWGHIDIAAGALYGLK